MFTPRRLDDTISVAPQIAPQDLAAIKAAGFVAVVNNRPDREEPGQPDGDTIRAATEAAGLAYHAIPVGQDGLTPALLAATAAVLADAGGPVLAYCRSGTRSCNLWALAAAQRGEAADALTAKAAGAGYDLTGLRGVLDRLAAGT